jgi:ribose-phosphate pyrophosphokinase
MQLLSLDGASDLASGLSRTLEQPLVGVEHRPFDDGEHKWRLTADPRGEDAYVLASLHGDDEATPQDKLVRLLVTTATLRDHGASRVTAVLPYLAYARKDVRTQPFDPLTSRLVAQWLESSGCDQVIALEVHNPAAFENAHRIPTIHLDAWRAFDPVVTAIVRATTSPLPLVVASPDPGGVKRVLRWREHLESRGLGTVGFAMVDKRRSLGLVSGGRLVAGDVDGARVLLLDDLIASGHTVAAAAAALRHAGAVEIHAFAAHGLFTGDADAVLSAAPLASLVVTDSVPPFRLPPSAATASRLRVVSAVPLLAEVLRDGRDAWQLRGG